MTWKELKERGSKHYKGSTDTEPLDLILSGGMLYAYCISNIIKYAYRNCPGFKLCPDKSDMEKIKHYTDILIWMGEGDK